MVFKHIYNLNYDNLVIWLLPTVLKRPKLRALLVAFTWPLRSLHNQFLLFSDSVRYKLIHTSQVIYLEKVLNDYYVGSYDPTDHENSKQIYITGGTQKHAKYIFLDTEEKPLFLSTFINTQQELNDSFVDFIIHIPSTISFQEDYLKALVDFYKLAGKTYIILII